eukprot:984637-Amorphochlora_amoeboformis.AAC.1
MDLFEAFTYVDKRRSCERIPKSIREDMEAFEQIVKAHPYRYGKETVKKKGARKLRSHSLPSG